MAAHPPDPHPCPGSEQRAGAPAAPIRPQEPVDVLIVGAGLIGLVTAWRAAQRGLRVVIVDPAPGSGASGVAAGMLTPSGEAVFGEEELIAFGMLSRERYPEFIAQLQACSGRDAGYRTSGTLQVAFDRDDLARLSESMDLQSRLGVAAQRLTGRECRRMEPMLAPSVRGGIHTPDDHSVDPRRLMSALWVAVERLLVRVVAARATEIAVDDGVVQGAVLSSGELLRADQVVLAAGPWTADLAGLPADVIPPIRPVKGQLLRLSTPSGEQPVVERTVRGLVHGFPVYLVPRDNGEIVLGATQEELGYDTRLTVGGVWEILRAARELVPALSELEITETCVGLRPGSPDNEPLLGPTRVTGLHLATGHHRHGVLLAPATGDAMAEALTTGQLPEYAQRFRAQRFDQRKGRVRQWM